jgi:predicted nuclease of predicted toxin-antitoxin system
MLVMMLDENVSPALARRLCENNVYCYHVRDRNLCGASDYELWEIAKEEERTIVTINGIDFRRLAGQEFTHPGIIVLPSCCSRFEQLNYILNAIDWAAIKGPMPPPFRDQFVTVSPTDIIAETVKLESSTIRIPISIRPKFNS